MTGATEVLSHSVVVKCNIALNSAFDGKSSTKFIHDQTLNKLRRIIVPLFLLDLTVVMNDDDGDHVGENGREATTDHLK